MLLIYGYHYHSSSILDCWMHLTPTSGPFRGRTHSCIRLIAYSITWTDKLLLSIIGSLSVISTNTIYWKLLLPLIILSELVYMFKIFVRAVLIFFLMTLTLNYNTIFFGKKYHVRVLKIINLLILQLQIWSFWSPTEGYKQSSN